jgi:hypothetical protein
VINVSILYRRAKERLQTKKIAKHVDLVKYYHILINFLLSDLKKEPNLNESQNI